MSVCAKTSAPPRALRGAAVAPKTRSKNPGAGLAMARGSTRTSTARTAEGAPGWDRATSATAAAARSSRERAASAARCASGSPSANAVYQHLGFDAAFESRLYDLGLVAPEGEASG